MRDRVIGAIAAVVVVASFAAAAWLVTSRTEPDPQAEAEAVVDAYLAAWEAWDVDRMAALQRDPDPDFVALHEDMRAALDPAATRIMRDAVVIADNETNVGVTVQLQLAYADTFSYDTTLTFQRGAGQWGLAWTPDDLYPGLRPSLKWRVDRAEVPRQPILAHDGTPLTAPGQLHTIGIEPRRIIDQDKVLATFARTLPKAVDELEELFADETLQPSWFYPVVTVRPEEFEIVWDQLRPLPGVIQRTQEARLGPSEGFGLQVLGTTETIDEARAAELGPPYEAGDEVGRYGLEAVYDRQLTSGSEVTIALVEPDDEVRAVAHRYRAEAAAPVRTTLDVRVQEAAEKAFLGDNDALAAIAAVDVTNGAIRAVTNRPTIGYGRAFEGRYPPGSTFKIVTAAALLASGVAPDEPVPCPAEATVGGRRIRNDGDADLGEIPFQTAFAQSCNTTFATLAADLPGDELAEAAADFGFGDTWDLPLPVFGAAYPEPADAAEAAEAAIGQGRVQASVIHLASVAAAVAHGAWHAPYLIDDEPSDRSRTIDPQVARDLQAMMREVVATGTGRAAQVDGTPLAGKTGSAEAVVDGRAVTHAWFVGFRDDLGFAVLVEEGGAGGGRAAELAGRFLRELDALRAAPVEAG